MQKQLSTEECTSALTRAFADLKDLQDQIETERSRLCGEADNGVWNVLSRCKTTEKKVSSLLDSASHEHNRISKEIKLQLSQVETMLGEVERLSVQEVERVQLNRGIQSEIIRILQMQMILPVRLSPSILKPVDLNKLEAILRATLSGTSTEADYLYLHNISSQILASTFQALLDRPCP